jgi:carbonic anhydrase
MKKSILFGCMTMALCASQAWGDTQWTYSTEYGHGGPDEWAGLSPDNAACAGKNQSPINLTDLTESKLTPINIAYQPGGNEVWNNGHTIQVNYAAGSAITVDKIAFTLAQFHFHAPSENRIDGKSYPMEGHFVHKDKSGSLAVIAVMFEEGAKNEALAKIWEHMPTKVDEKNPIAPPFQASTLYPPENKRGYFRFNGSLTTPPCSEGVRWLVMKHPVAAFKEQIEQFAHTIHHPNNRPVQAINARSVLK